MDQRRSPRIELYDDDVEPVPGVTVARIGGHFDGAAVLHWPSGFGGRGALLTGDTVKVVEDRGWVSFMWSYPNLIPLDASRSRKSPGGWLGSGSSGYTAGGGATWSSTMAPRPFGVRHNAMSIGCGVGAAAAPRPRDPTAWRNRRHQLTAESCGARPTRGSA